MRAILDWMTTEIERKFLVRDIPEPSTRGAGEQLRQGYLAEEGSVAIRIRITESTAWLTVKAGKGLQRTEVEFEVTPEQTSALWPHTSGRQIDKRRYTMPLGRHADAAIAELDLYAGDLEGLATVEVEFASVCSAEGFEPPSWFGEDVTDIKGWSNAELARNGRPDR